MELRSVFKSTYLRNVDRHYSKNSVLTVWSGEWLTPRPAASAAVKCRYPSSTSSTVTGDGRRAADSATYLAGRGGAGRATSGRADRHGSSARQRMGTLCGAHQTHIRPRHVTLRHASSRHVISHVTRFHCTFNGIPTKSIESIPTDNAPFIQWKFR